MVALQNHVADAEDFTAALEAPGGWSIAIDPVAAGFTSGTDETEPDWYDYYGDGDFPYDPAQNHLTCWFKFTVPVGEGRALRISTEGSHYLSPNGPSSFDTQIWVFTDEPVPQILFQDPFTRTVASGLGGSYTDAAGGWSEDPVSVDGSKAIAGGADYGAAVVRNASIPHPEQFDLLFDFSTPSVGSTHTYLWISLGKLYIELFPSNTTASPLLYSVGGGKSTSDTASVPVLTLANQPFEPDSTYRARVRLDVNTAYVRFTKIGPVRQTEEPAWLGSWDVTGGFDASFWMDFESGNDGDVQTLDNLTVQTISTPWWDWPNTPPFPGNARLLMYEDDYSAWQGLDRPPRRNSYISPETYEGDGGFEGTAPLFTEGTYLVNIGSYMFYELNNDLHVWQSGQGEYLIEASLEPWVPPDAPEIFLSNNWREAIDMVPVLPAPDGNGGRGVQYTGPVSVATHDTDPNDPNISIPGVSEISGKGFRTGWMKAVLPISGVLSFDFEGTNYKHALLAYQYDEALDALTLVGTAIPYARGNRSEYWNVPHVMNGMLAGQTTAPTGIPGIDHNALMWRTYSLVEVYVPGPSGSWSDTPDGAWYGSGTYPDTLYFDVNVSISMWNSGYAKVATLKVQYFSSGQWFDVAGVTHDTGQLTDSRSGYAHTWVQTYGPITIPFSTGRFRLVAEENGWGSEIWTYSRKLTARGYFRPRLGSIDVPTGNALKYARRFEAGTYYFCLTQYENDATRTTASATVSLTHPRR